MCAAILALESIALGLSTPVMIAVEDVEPGPALVAGLGLAVASLLTAGLLRFRWAYGAGHLIQIGALALGLLVPVMVVIGAMFAVLWVVAVLLGRRIEADRARWADEHDDDGPGTPTG